MTSRESIAELAYHLWVARGRPHGSHDQDWLEAERQLGAAEESRGNRRAADGSPSASQRPATPSQRPAGGRKPRDRSASASKGAGAASSAAKASVSRASRSPPVDETDDAPRSAAHDIGEG